MAIFLRERALLCLEAGSEALADVVEHGGGQDFDAEFGEFAKDAGRTSGAEVGTGAFGHFEHGVPFAGNRQGIGDLEARQAAADHGDAFVLFGRLDFSIGLIADEGIAQACDVLGVAQVGESVETALVAADAVDDAVRTALACLVAELRIGELRAAPAWWATWGATARSSRSTWAATPPPAGRPGGSAPKARLRTPPGPERQAELRLQGYRFF